MRMILFSAFVRFATVLVFVASSSTHCVVGKPDELCASDMKRDFDLVDFRTATPRVVDYAP